MTIFQTHCAVYITSLKTNNKLCFLTCQTLFQRMYLPFLRDSPRQLFGIWQLINIGVSVTMGYANKTHICNFSILPLTYLSSKPDLVPITQHAFPSLCCSP